MSVVLQIYHRLPAFARQAAASWHGLQLRRWRYGPETDALMRAARERELWAPDRWQRWQKATLAITLQHAMESVPAYRKEWQSRRVAGDRRSADTLQNWPILSKELLRGSPDDFLTENAPLNRLRVEQTSGTSGTPVRLRQSRETVRHWYALMEARWRGWYGLSRADRWAILGGQLVTPIHQNSPPYWVWNAGLRQLYLSSSHLSARTCADYWEALQTHRVTYLWGYASALYSLALFADELDLPASGLSVVISNAEPLYAHQRRLISRVFGCPVRDTYGLSEMVCGASECESGQLHLWPEAGVYEVLHEDEDKPVEPGQIGRLVCTGLLNRDMPLIRYDVGDRVALAPAGQSCACGRTLPILLSVDGRNDDVIQTPDGRRIGRMDPVFKGNIPMREGQIIQESLDLIRVLVVPAPEFSTRHEHALTAAVQERVGNIPVRIERVSEIPRSANGKFRAVISNLKRSGQAEAPMVNNDSTLRR